MTFALIASRALETQEFEIGAVAIYAPRGDGSSFGSSLLISIKSWNPNSARGRSFLIIYFPKEDKKVILNCPFAELGWG